MAIARASLTHPCEILQQHANLLQLAFQMAPAIPLVFITLLLPESPRWLMIKGREEEALHTLAKLHSRGDINNAMVRGEFEEMRRKVNEEKAVTKGWSEVSYTPQWLLVQGIAG
jgi:hypothetical protein